MAGPYKSLVTAPLYTRFHDGESRMGAWRMVMHFGDLARQSVIDGTIEDADVLALRRIVWASGTIDAEQAEEILALNNAISAPSDAWTGFFVEAITEFLMSTSSPRGHLGEAQADWLILRMDRDGRLDSPAQLELLIHLFERMDSVPDRMKAYALVQIERAVVFGTGPTRGAGDATSAGRITPEECTAIRRLIFAPSSGGPARVNAEEAEMLFRIKDATLGADNAPEWQKLFVQGVASYLQGWQGLTMPTPMQEAEHERFLASRPQGIRGLLGAMARTSPTGLVSAVRNPGGFGRKGLPRDHVREARADHAVTATEQAWLDRHIAADQQVDPLERALLTFMASEG